MRLFFLILFSSTLFAQQHTVVDYERFEVDVTPDFEKKTISGDLVITLSVLKDTDSLFLDAKNLIDYSATLHGKKLSVRYEDGRLYFLNRFRESETYTLTLSYTAQPSQALYFVNNQGSNQLWTQGQGKYTSNWLPSIDDMSDKIEFDITVQTPAAYTVVSNGELLQKKQTGNLVAWQFDMQQPMSSYLVALAIGAYDKWEIASTSGIPIELYYYPQDSVHVEPTYRYTQQIFDFLEGEIGVPYPWQNYKQVPVKDFLYAGMENTTATVFSDQFVIDTLAFKDRNYVNVNAHELAHQWFGDYVTESSGTHHWLQEGFATYYALLAERQIFGDEYYYYQLYNTAEQLKELSDKGKGEKLLNPKASSLTFYQKGAWALHILRERIGDGAFKMAVIDYLERHAYDNVETQDFLAAAQKASGEDLSDFKKDWLEQSAFMATQALNSLKKSPFINAYLQVKALRKVDLVNKERELRKALIRENDVFIGQEAAYQLVGEPLSISLPLYSWAFDLGNSWVRQALAISIEKIPGELQDNFETLLEDDSYVTREQALLKLWMQFPANRSRYLNKLKGIPGFKDKNIETLWLALTLATPQYEPHLRDTRYAQLVSYTSAQMPFQVRQNAFQYLYQTQLFETESLTNLLAGCLHHNWRFAQFCRAILDDLIADSKWKIQLQNLDILTPKHKDFLNQKLQ